MNLNLHDDINDIIVLYSGGIDSTILLYLLATQYPEKTITAVTAGCSYVENRVHLPPAYRVIEKINQLVTPGAINEHIIHYNDERTGHHCSSFLENLYKSRKFDCVVIGQNKTPPKDVFILNEKDNVWVNLYDECQSQIRKNPSGDIWSIFENKWKEYRPLKYLDKKQIIQIYHDCNVFDDLIPLTRSCTRMYDKNFNDIIIDTPGYIKYVDHCGWCWYCLERKWGLQNE